MKLIDGKQISADCLESTRQEVARLKEKGLTPGLAVVLVGDDPASRSYVRSKDRTCQELGLHSVKLELPEDTTQEELLDVVAKLNQDDAVDGILVQSPPPSHIDEAAVVHAIDPNSFGHIPLLRCRSLRPLKSASKS